MTKNPSISEQILEDEGMVMAVGKQTDEALARFWKKQNEKDHQEWVASISVACGVLFVLALILLSGVM